MCGGVPAAEERCLRSGGGWGARAQSCEFRSGAVRIAVIRLLLGTALVSFQHQRALNV
jgi:hypothetical protein